MSPPSLKLKLKSQKRERISQEPPNNIITEARNRSILRTITFCPPKRNALGSSRSIEDILKFATGARRQRPHQSSGNGIIMVKSGIDGMTTSGTTGAHPREDSPPADGLGIKDSGITTAGSSSITDPTGIDSKVENGSDMVELSRLTQPHQEARKSADLSTCLRSLDSQVSFHKRPCQDARLDQEEAQSTICGKIEQPVDSLEEDLLTKNTEPVRLANHISGLESSDVSKVQSSQRRD